MNPRRLSNVLNVTAELLCLILRRVGQWPLMIKHRAEIAHVEPAEIIFTNVRRAGLGFARLDRGFDFRAVTCPLDRA
jgi:hypothetical protein